MSKSKYVAYVSTYTMGDNHGIKIYDVDMANGRLKEKAEVEITNSSYVTISHSGKFLYSITDFGVEAFKILEDGNLELINKASINGMRGCYLSTDYEDKFLFCAGYHDGKITVLRLDPETGTIGEITEEIFHKGLGSIAERSFRPHISCVKMTRDNKYLCAADLGIDYVNVYKLDHEKGTLKQVDIIRCDLESAPRHLKFSDDGRYLYVVSELRTALMYTIIMKKMALHFLTMFRPFLQLINTRHRMLLQVHSTFLLTVSIFWLPMLVKTVYLFMRYNRRVVNSTDCSAFLSAGNIQRMLPYSRITSTLYA